MTDNGTSANFMVKVESTMILQCNFHNHLISQISIQTLKITGHIMKVFYNFIM